MIWKKRGQFAVVFFNFSGEEGSFTFVHFGVSIVILVSLLVAFLVVNFFVFLTFHSQWNPLFLCSIGTGKVQGISSDWLACSCICSSWSGRFGFVISGTVMQI